jgi:uncharacterized membrane protein
MNEPMSGTPTPAVSPSPAVTPPDVTPFEREKHLIEIWAKHEDVAMHFNDLTLRLRLQALAGVGAAALIAGSVFSHQGRIELQQVGWFLVALSIIWAGIGLLDAFYYQALLKGAVVSIKEVEKNLPSVKLSTIIENNVGYGGKVARALFYGSTGLLLLGGGISLVRLDKGPSPIPEPVCASICQTPCTSASSTALQPAR